MRRLLTHHWGLLAPDDPERLIDSAPIPVCSYARAGENRTVNGSEYFSAMARRKAKLFGLRLHLSTSKDQLIDDWLLARAAHHDSQVLPALFEDATDRVALGDSAFGCYARAT